MVVRQGAPVLGNALGVTRHHHHYHYRCEHGSLGKPLLNARIGHGALQRPLVKTERQLHINATQGILLDPPPSGEGTLLSQY